MPKDFDSDAMSVDELMEYFSFPEPDKPGAPVTDVKLISWKHYEE